LKHFREFVVKELMEGVFALLPIYLTTLLLLRVERGRLVLFVRAARDPASDVPAGDVWDSVQPKKHPGGVRGLPDVGLKGDSKEKGFLSRWFLDAISTKTALFSWERTGNPLGAIEFTWGLGFEYPRGDNDRYRC
jgi:hypothetical protein